MDKERKKMKLIKTLAAQPGSALDRATLVGLTSVGDSREMRIVVGATPRRKHQKEGITLLPMVHFCSSRMISTGVTGCRWTDEDRFRCTKRPEVRLTHGLPIISTVSFVLGTFDVKLTRAGLVVDNPRNVKIAPIPRAITDARRNSKCDDLLRAPWGYSGGAEAVARNRGFNDPIDWVEVEGLLVLN